MVKILKRGRQIYETTVRQEKCNRKNTENGMFRARNNAELDECNPCGKYLRTQVAIAFFGLIWMMAIAFMKLKLRKCEGCVAPIFKVS